MARYIDADKIDYKLVVVGEAEFAGYHAIAYERDVDDLPTENVVLAYEVDKAREEGYESGKRQISAEIFYNVERSILSLLPNEIRIIGEFKDFSDGVRLGERDAIVRCIVAITELKKKYTEGEK